MLEGRLQKADIQDIIDKISSGDIITSPDVRYNVAAFEKRYQEMEIERQSPGVFRSLFGFNFMRYLPEYKLESAKQEFAKLTAKNYTNQELMNYIKSQQKTENADKSIHQPSIFENTLKHAANLFGTNAEAIVDEVAKRSGQAAGLAAGAGTFVATSNQAALIANITTLAVANASTIATGAVAVAAGGAALAGTAGLFLGVKCAWNYMSAPSTAPLTLNEALGDAGKLSALVQKAHKVVKKLPKIHTTDELTVTIKNIAHGIKGSHAVSLEHNR